MKNYKQFILEINKNGDSNIELITDSDGDIYLIDKNSSGKIKKGDLVYNPYSDVSIIIDDENLMLYVNDNYYKVITTYVDQKEFLLENPDRVSDFLKICNIDPRIKKEFPHLFTGVDLNLL
jgi:hypothetical protein